MKKMNDNFQVYILEKRDSLGSEYKSNSVRWVIAIRSGTIRCSLVARDLNLLDPRRGGLYTVRRAAHQAKLMFITRKC